jgi:hypothetical protein
MGCDFYIYVYLEIHHINGISYYELPTIRGYYCEFDSGICDSDDDENNYYNTTEYNTLYENMKKFYLTPRKPVVIYENKSFITPKFEMKYLPNIQDKINKQCTNRYEDTGVFTSIEQVIKVIKKEERNDPFDSDYFITK